MIIPPDDLKSNIYHAYYTERDRLEEKYSITIFACNHDIFFTMGDIGIPVHNEEAMKEHSKLLQQIETDYHVKIEIGEASILVSHPERGVFEL